MKRDTCWEYSAYERKDGYMMWKTLVSGKRKLAHRVVYEKLIGEIPRGFVLDHLCRNRKCVNPSHLEPVSPRENILRGVGSAAKNHAKTTCKRGHSFTKENTYLRNGSRSCKECKRNWDKQHPRKQLKGKRFYV
jgi:hypothetical protein